MILILYLNVLFIVNQQYLSLKLVESFVQILVKYIAHAIKVYIAIPTTRYPPIRV